jgi:hypothetical protein
MFKSLNWRDFDDLTIHVQNLDIETLAPSTPQEIQQIVGFATTARYNMLTTRPRKPAEMLGFDRCSG